MRMSMSGNTATTEPRPFSLSSTTPPVSSRISGLAAARRSIAGAMPAAIASAVMLTTSARTVIVGSLSRRQTTGWLVA